MLISAGEDELVHLCRQWMPGETQSWPPPLVAMNLPKAEAERLRDTHNAIVAEHEKAARDCGESERIADVMARLNAASEAASEAGETALNDLLCDAFATIRFLRNPKSLYYLRLVADEGEE
jgi:hypothetical protein